MSPGSDSPTLAPVESDGLPIDFTRPGVIWLDELPVPIEPTGTGKAVARLREGRLVVGGGSRTQVLAAIDRWYRREARKRIEPLVVIEGERLGLEAKKVRIGNQRTRWGSCSTSGTVSFNWRLVIGRPEALHYVVVHELIHLRHHNHSRAFWDALAEAFPDFKREATWLRSNERELLKWKPRI
ncbi:MAG: M48 family metallopeptidase [Solirubrobacterales bacterium]|nr:M48 family metallopeptidase [Solirubrobacterales bacterium]MCB0860681.1 M48 family metallopeptidase [Solirubrobacterales bacterium]HRV60812.1 M48 family metallopeptidase [Solirubrobacterales bacterium]